MWTLIKKILPFHISRIGLGGVLELNEISLNWDKTIEGLFGVEWGGKSRPISLKDRILVVDCLNSVWASEFQIKKEKIISQINQSLGKGLVEKIRFIS